MQHNPPPPWMPYRPGSVRPPPPPDVLQWGWSRFDELGVNALYDTIALRTQVFVVEQKVAYQELDGSDRYAWHVLGRDGQGNLQASLRVIDPGVKFAEIALGRVVVTPGLRQRGWGRALMEQGMACAAWAWPGWPIRISAQEHLQGFYRSFGFETVTSTYLEDDIPHVQMLYTPVGEAALPGKTHPDAET